MCMDGVSHLVMTDERIQQALSNPQLDLVHKQVLMVLYSMEASGSLHECHSLLPLYLAMDTTRCEAILSTLEEAGLIGRGAHGVELTYKLAAEQTAGSCGRHSH